MNHMDCIDPKRKQIMKFIAGKWDGSRKVKDFRKNEKGKKKGKKREQRKKK